MRLPGSSSVALPFIVDKFGDACVQTLLLDMIINKKFGKLKCPNTSFVVAPMSVPSDGATPKNEISYWFGLSDIV